MVDFLRQSNENGNRTGDEYTVGAYNRITRAGDYTYQYDAEGNLQYQFVDSTDPSPDGVYGPGDTNVTEYTWDYRNRLVSVTKRAAYGEAATWAVDYVYDAFNRRVASLYDDNGDAVGGKHDEYYLYDGTDVCLDFVDADGPGETASPELARRYLWNPAAVDQLLAQENFDDGSPADVSWTLGDHLNSTRDIVNYSGTVVAGGHFVYESFGGVVAGDVSLCRYLYTCQEYAIGMGGSAVIYHCDARITLSWLGRFASEDIIQFTAGDENLYRYVKNGPTNARDPSGLSELSSKEYLRRIRQRYDNGTRDMDRLWRLSMQDYLDADPEDDWWWDAEDDMEEVIEAYWDFFSDTSLPSFHGGFGEFRERGDRITCGAHTGDGSAVSHFFLGAAWEGCCETGDTAQWSWEHAGRGSNSAADPEDTNRDNAYAWAGADFSDLLDRWSEREVRDIIKKFASGEVRLTDILGSTPPDGTVEGAKQYRKDVRARMKTLLGYDP